jgi:quinoprotein glucose dehydrogenase
MLKRCATKVLLTVFLCASGSVLAQGWPVYGGDEGGQHHAPLALINRSNVAELELAWSYRHGELDDFEGPRMLASWHVTPILVPKEAGESLVICTPFNRVIALDPVNGQERWVFDPESLVQISVLPESLMWISLRVS